MRHPFPLCVLLFLTLSGCSQGSMMKIMTAPEDESAATAYIDLLRDNRFAEIKKDLDPSINIPNVDGRLARMAMLFPAQQPLSVKVVRNQYVAGPDFSSRNLTFEYQFPAQWLLANVAIRKKGNVSMIVGLNVYPLPDSLENLNKFKLEGKSRLQYGVLGLMAVAVLFTLYVLVLCIRTRIPRRKWLWIVCILFGVGKLSVNWTTGQWNVQLLAVQLFSASAFAPLYNAWTLSVSLPLAAIWFLMRRTHLAAEADPQVQQSMPVPSE